MCRLKIYPCLTPFFDENELVSPSVNLIEYLTSLYIFFKILIIYNEIVYITMLLC